MADTSLKFGPEWLRALTEPQSSMTFAPSLSNMKLADFRYGREEMLALFDKDVIPSQDLFTLGALFVEKCQYPLNLIQMGDDETKAWQKGANSEASLRPFGGQTKKPPSPVRGRGRGKGGVASYPHYERNRGNEDETESCRPRLDREERNFSAGRGRSNTERNWMSEKIKVDDSENLTGARKGYSKAPTEDWRGGRTGEGNKCKEDGWRPTQGNRGWNGNQASWRSSDRPKPDSVDRWRKEEDEKNRQLRCQQREKDAANLPEWAVNDMLDEADGSFDDSGKFKTEKIPCNPNAGNWECSQKWDSEEVDPDSFSELKPKSSEPPITGHLEALGKEKKSDDGLTNVGGASEFAQNSVDMETMAGNLVSALIDDDRSYTRPTEGVGCDSSSGLLGVHINWTYLDPQGKIQGPFSSEEMLEWCTAGYFPHDLMVKRNIDEKFTSMTELSKIYGRNPYTPGPTPPSIKNDNIEDHLQQQQLLHLHHLYLQQQHLLAQQQHMFLLQQQQQQQGTDMAKFVFPSNVNPIGSNEYAEAKADIIHCRENEPKNHGDLSREMFQENVISRENRNFDNSSTISGNNTNSQSMSPVQTEKNPPESYERNEFDPIKSLLDQLQMKSVVYENSEASNTHSLSNTQSIPKPDLQTDEDLIMKRTHSRDVVKDEDGCKEQTKNVPVLSESKKLDKGEVFEEMEEKSPFQIPKIAEKREKKTKRADERRKAKDSKACTTHPSYIPGMPGSKQPTEQIRVKNNFDEVKRIAEPTSSNVISPENSIKKEGPLKQTRAEKVSKPAPWAVKELKSNDQHPKVSLQEIQRMESEKEQLEKAFREESMHEAQMLEEQERMKRQKSSNWGVTGNFYVKSLSEIQAEESKVQKDRHMREIKEKRLSRDTEPELALGKSSGSSWAGKIASSSPNVTNNHLNKTESGIASSDGFWEPLVAEHREAPANKQSKKPANTADGKEGKNEFESWCVRALERLNTDVDIPTFLNFLIDIESPYEVHDYVKSYIGEGKAEKKFATQYLERRSKWKNAKRSGKKHDDDLTTPAVALSPSDGDFQEAGRKGKKKAKNTKSNMNHLLGFSVRGKGVNRGELDLAN